MPKVVLEDEKRFHPKNGWPKKFEVGELKALLLDCCQTQEELIGSLGVTQAVISKSSEAK